jgi:hypothetical protein
VFEAEVSAIILALDIIRSVHRVREVTILLDNQAAIASALKARPRPGQYLIHLLQSELCKLLKARPALRIHITWIPGHSGVESNEWADREAKSTTEGSSTPLACRIKIFDQALPSSIAALKAAHKKLTAVSWKAAWSSSRRAHHQSKFDKSPPGARVLKLYQGLPRRSCSILTQLCTGFVGLNKYLTAIGAVDSPLCPKCHVPESVEHFLLHCCHFVEERHSLRLALGHSCQRLTLSSAIAAHKNITPLLRYVHATERFPMFIDYYDDTKSTLRAQPL